MALPSRNSVQTLDFSGYGQPAAYLEAKSLSSGTLDYSSYAQPVVGLTGAAPVVVVNGSFMVFFLEP